MKRKINYLIKSHPVSNILRTVFCCVLSILLIITSKSEVRELVLDLGKSEFVISLVVFMILDLIAQLITRIILILTEDAAKVSFDVKGIMKRYSLCNLVKEGELSYPVLSLWEKRIGVSPQFEINDKETGFYKLPKQIDSRFDEIFSAHKMSTVYNQINIRLSDFEDRGDRIILSTERTRYFDLLVTNRAMDVVWKNGFTVRELYEPGPYLNSLKDSRLANHIGINGLIETNDGYIFLVKRSLKVSTGKGMYNFCVSGSLKTKYIFDGVNTDTKKITDINYLWNAVSKEIIDEMNLRHLNLDDKSLNDLVRIESSNIVSVYRDVMEGGKPHFLFYKRIELSMEEIKKCLGNIKHSNHKDMDVDGNRFVEIKVEDIKKMQFGQDYIKLEGQPPIYMSAASVGLMTIVKKNLITASI